MHPPLPQNDELVALHWFLPVLKIIPRIRLAQRRKGTLQAFLQEVFYRKHRKQLCRKKTWDFRRISSSKRGRIGEFHCAWFVGSKWWIEHGIKLKNERKSLPAHWKKGEKSACIFSEFYTVLFSLCIRSLASSFSPSSEKRDATIGTKLVRKECDFYVVGDKH